MQVLSSIVAYNTSAFFEGGSGSPNNAPAGALIELQTQTKGVGESQLLNSSHAIYKELQKVKMSPAAPSASSDTGLAINSINFSVTFQRINSKSEEF